MSADYLDKKVKLLLNHVEFEMTYGEIIENWSEVTEKSGWQGTGGDYRHIANVIHDLFTQACAHGPGRWYSDYVPYSVPPVAIKLMA